MPFLWPDSLCGRFHTLNRLCPSGTDGFLLQRTEGCCVASEQTRQTYKTKGGGNPSLPADVHSSALAQIVISNSVYSHELSFFFCYKIAAKGERRGPNLSVYRNTSSMFHTIMQIHCKRLEKITFGVFRRKTNVCNVLSVYNGND